MAIILGVVRARRLVVDSPDDVSVLRSLSDPVELAHAFLLAGSGRAGRTGRSSVTAPLAAVGAAAFAGARYALQRAWIRGFADHWQAYL